MRNRIRYSILALVLVVNVVLNVILFLTVKNVENQLSNPAFWITWTVTFPVNILAWVYVFVSTSKAQREDEVNLIPLLRTTVIANIVFLVVGMITMYIPSDKYSWIAALIVELILLVIYIFTLVFISTGVAYIRKSRENTRKKVFYIRDLATDLTAVFSMISDNDALAKVKQLADDIKYSDPMSHESLIDIETEIRMAVNNIVEAAMSNDASTIIENVTLASNKLKFRNTKCAILK